jgi:tetratricopeptide (TPR) repeat protein
VSVQSKLLLCLLVASMLPVGVSGTQVHSRREAPANAVAHRVRVWEDSLVLPTYEEGLPDVNAPFDIFTSARFNYPYTIRDQLTSRRAPRRWRTLNLENEYLRCTVLPDLGGHLYTCVDKVNGQDLFYANGSIKLANISYRGAWAALGIEFNFPVSHNWMTVSPVDFATTENPDGSACIWVGNIDRVYGGQWRVRLMLRPERARLEQRTWLYNRSAQRHRFYWWTNAAVRVQDDSQILYPMQYTASHGFTEVDTWPVNAKGVDLSRVGNHTDGPVSRFSHGSREAFMAVYHPSTSSGVVHYSGPVDLPAKKIWSWGSDPDGLDWRVALSDDKSAYVEVQAGLFRNQETYAFLEPQETIAFDEYWLPLRDTAGLVRATPDSVLNLIRTVNGSDSATLETAITVTRPVVKGHLRLLDGPRLIDDQSVSFNPSQVLRRSFTGLAQAPKYTIELRDASGVLIEHTEDRYDVIPSNEIKTGPQPTRQLPPPPTRTDAQALEAGELAEMDGKLLDAYREYQRALAVSPDAFSLRKAAGRLAVALKRPDEAIDHLSRAAAWVSNDPEVEYYLGQAYLRKGADDQARSPLDQAQQRVSFRAVARFELARLAARRQDLLRAESLLDETTREFPDAIRLGAARVSVLRHLSRTEEARRQVAHWRRIDPTSNALRYEAVLLGDKDERLWTHLAADPDRLLEMSVDYMELGFFEDAAALLARPLPRGPEVVTEPGMPAADGNPLIAYYRAYCRMRTGQEFATDLDAAARMPTTYVFPNRPETFGVLEAALKERPGDAHARFLLGSLHLSGGVVDRALESWAIARKENPRTPTLHRNIGFTYLLGLDRPDLALEAFRDGLDFDAENVGLYIGIDQALSLDGHSAADRAAALARYPNPEAMPPAVSFKLAIALAEAGRFDQAEQVFANRFFPREEGGTNVRQVYLEIRLLRAHERAVQQQCEEALAIIDHLTDPVDELAFTQDGLLQLARGPRMRFVLADVEHQCGRGQAADEHWKSLLTTDVGFPFSDVVFGYKAALRLCAEQASNACRETAGRDWRPRLETALTAATRQIDVVGTNLPGSMRYAQGLLLSALGRSDEAKRRLRDALLAPDRMLSHHLAREAMTELLRDEGR